MNKRAIVIGGSYLGSIGQAAIKLLLKKGWKLDLFDFRFSYVGNEWLRKFRPINVSHEGSVTAAFKILARKKYDALLYMAGVNLPAKIDDPHIESHWTRSERVNALGALNCIREFIPLRKPEKSIGVIIGSNTTSVPRSGSICYGASKMALAGITKHGARELASKKLALVQLDFGVVKGTPMTFDAQEKFKMDFKKLRYRQKWPFDLTPQEAAEWIAFVMDKGHMATGNSLKIDGAEA